MKEETLQVGEIGILQNFKEHEVLNGQLAEVVGCLRMRSYPGVGYLKSYRVKPLFSEKSGVIEQHLIRRVDDPDKGESIPRIKKIELV